MNKTGDTQQTITPEEKQTAIVVSPSDNKSQQQKQEAHPNLNKGNFGNEGGRPTKYDPKFADEIIEFFNVERTIRYIKAEKIVEKANGTKETFYEYGYMPNELPTLDKFAFKIGVDRKTLQRWAEDVFPDDYEIVEKRGKLKRPKFCRAYNTAKILQKDFLTDNGLRGMYPPAAFIFVSKNVTDMRDKVVDPEPSPTDENTPKRIVGFNYLPPAEAEIVDADNTNHQANS